MHTSLEYVFNLPELLESRKTTMQLTTERPTLRYSFERRTEEPLLEQNPHFTNSCGLRCPYSLSRHFKNGFFGEITVLGSVVFLQQALEMQISATGSVGAHKNSLHQAFISIINALASRSKRFPQ